RVFVHLRLDDAARPAAAQPADDSVDAGRQSRSEPDAGRENALAALADSGHPVVTVHLRDIYDIGEQIFLWEMAVAIAGHLLGIQPFDQPNVETAKVLARKMVAAYQETGSLPAAEMVEASGSTLRAFLSQARPGDYIALQAYVEPTAATTAALQELRIWMREVYHVATTIGYGPRYLHSTGQLHKGDAGNGLFIQFTAKHAEDAAIPDRAGDAASVLSFGVLEHAQALGDYRALVDNRRRVIHFRLGVNVAAELAHLLKEALG
ncbi:MAG: glucose-6-phosphate isomerase, partial [Anaerolineae bacterium]